MDDQQNLQADDQLNQSDLEQNQNDESVDDQNLSDLQIKANQYLEGWKRAKADYLNLKKDTEKRQIEVIEFANAALLAAFIPIFNNFKLAWRHIPEEQQKLDWVIGFEHIKKQMADFLQDLGIVEIKTVGEKFNPDVHEALVHEQKEGFAPDVVFEEVSAGYTLHGKVLQPAKVKVAK